MFQLREISDRAKQTRHERNFDVVDLEVRDGADGKVTFDGIASVVDQSYEVRDMFGDYQETMAKGAFHRTLKQKDDVRLLVNHDGVPLARTKSKTLTLTADPHLRSVAQLDPSNPTVQEIRSAMTRGDMDQMSIGFRVLNQEWNADYSERTIKEIQLFDVSVVTFPASPTTTASVRSVDDLLAADMSSWSEDEIRRAIAYMTDLLPTVEERTDDQRLARTSRDLLVLWEARRSIVFD